jgi:hypothetical protein
VEPYITPETATTPWGCWIWTGAAHERGYGRIRWRGRIRSTHRVAFEVFYKEVPPDDKLVLHTCDEARCINPDHLYLGTQRDNMQDRIARNRVPRSAPQTRAQAEDWIKLHSTQAARANARVEILREWLETDALQARQKQTLDVHS